MTLVSVKQIKQRRRHAADTKHIDIQMPQQHTDKIASSKMKLGCAPGILLA